MVDGFSILCCVCGHRRGLHSTHASGAVLCPPYNDQDKVFDQGCVVVPAKVEGPRKPVPILPVEVFSTKKFNADEAWAAIVALSKGS
jgi:hypothetical protein